MREEFVEWWRSPENNRAPGNTCLRACHLLAREDRRWQDASQTGSKGCGANMRVAPVGLAPGLTDEQRAGAAQLQSALTHGHPTALAASDLTAHAVRLLAEGAEPTGLIGLLRSYAYDNRTRYHESWLGDLWTRAQDPTPEHFIARGWDECLEVLERLRDAVRTVSPETDPCLATGEGWDRGGGPGDRPALLPALRRRTPHRPAPRRLHLRRLRLHRLPGGRLRGRLPGRGRLARRLGVPHRVPRRTADPRHALGRLSDDRHPRPRPAPGDRTAARPGAVRHGLRRAPVRLPVP
ncbi:hypothetical protein GCM10019016_041250 [Streptomyces prasinosporus]|uniref:Uncharacterized protein n=1 Tax=Streptomyces prasinosporus TaxID=68256 RepID=A0ABP6TP30_9ACTN